MFICYICPHLFNLLIIFIYLELLTFVIIVKGGCAWNIDFLKETAIPYPILAGY